MKRVFAILWGLWVSGAVMLATAGDVKETRELLSRHDTIAVFDGLVDHRCMFRTALCPDRCGHGGKAAVFTIKRYLAYERPGEYGDAKQEKFQLLVEDTQGNAKVSGEVLKAIKALQKGDEVRLEWRHDYVTRDGSKFPERVIVRISKGEPA